MNERRNILIVTPNNLIGGAENILRMSASELCKKDRVEIFHITYQEGHDWSHTNEKIHITSSATKNFFVGFFQLFLYVFKRRNNKLVIFTSHTFITAFIGILRSFRLIKIDAHIARESTSIFERFKGIKLLMYRILYFAGYRNLNVIICQTDLMKGSLIQNAPYLAERGVVIVIDNPIDLVDAEKKSREVLDGEFFSNKSFKVVAAGRLIKEKGFDILINAFYRVIQSKHDYGKIELYILGEGSERFELEKLIKVLNLSSNVFLVGNVSNVYPYFKSADLCIVSSRIEGFPNVLLQMMSVNGNVISTLCAGGIDSIPKLNVCDANEESIFNSIMSFRSSNTYRDYLNSRDIVCYINTLRNYI